MEMNGRSTVSYLVRSPRVPFFMLISKNLEAKGFLVFQGRRGIVSVVRWNLRPVFFGVEYKLGMSLLTLYKQQCANEVPFKKLGSEKLQFLWPSRELPNARHFSSETSR